MDYRATMRGQEYFISERMLSGIHRYIQDGVIPGSFLQAVICDELHNAMACADDENFHNLPAFVSYFYLEAPAPCWGSRERMDAWALQKQQERNKGQ